MLTPRRFSEQVNVSDIGPRLTAGETAWYTSCRCPFHWRSHHMPPALQIRQDILKNYPELFGPKTIDGRTVTVESLIAQLTTQTRDEFHQLLQARHAFHL